MALIGVLAFREGEALQQSVETLQHDSEDTLVIHVDGDDPDTLAVARSLDYDFLHVNPVRQGVAPALNRILAHREPGQDFYRVDGDTWHVTPEPVRRLSDASRQFGAVAPIWRGNRYEEAVREWLKAPGSIRPIPTRIPIGGCIYYPGWVVDRLGGFRSHGGFYGCQERDYMARIHGLGADAAYIPTVENGHPPIKPLPRARKYELEEAFARFSKAKERYNRGEDLYQEIDGWPRESD